MRIFNHIVMSSTHLLRTILYLLRHVARGVVISVMLIALYSCGGSNNGGGGGSSSDEVNLADNVGPPSANTTITPPSYEARFSFGAENYEVTVDGEVEITINLTKGDEAFVAPAGGLNLILEEAVGGVPSVPAVRPVVTMAEGESSAIFTYLAEDREAGDVVTYSFNFDFVESDDGETKYGKRAPRETTITVETNDVSFISGGVGVTVGGTAEGFIILSRPANQQITVPVNVLEVIPSSSGSKTSVVEFVFEEGEDSKSFSYQAATSSANGYVTYSLPETADSTPKEPKYDLPAGLQAGEFEIFTFTIQEDPDLEGIYANFGETEYLMNPGQSVDIDLRLTSNEDLTIPISINAQYRNLTGGGWQDVTVIFPVNQDTTDLLPNGITEKRTTLNYNGTEGDREYRLDAGTIGGGIKVGMPNIAAVKVVSGEIGFAQATQNANNGDTVNVTVELAAAAVQAFDVVIDIAGTDTNGDPVPDNETLNFQTGETSKTFSYNTSGKEADSAITFSIGLPLPAGITITTNGNKTHIVQLRTDTITFDNSTYTNVKQGSVLDIPMTMTRTGTGSDLVPLSITHLRAGKVISTDNSKSVIFAKGSATAVYKLPTTNYTIDDVVKVTFGSNLSASSGLEEGAIKEVTATITYRNLLTFSQDYLRLGVGRDVTFQLELDEVATAPIDIKVTGVETPQGGTATTIFEQTISFGIGEQSKDITYNGALSVLGTEIVYTMSDFSNGIGTGDNETFTIAISDTSINFGAATYKVRENNSIKVKVVTVNPINIETKIPVNISGTIIPGEAIIPAGDTEGFYTFNATAGTAGNHVDVTFGTLPHGLQTDPSGIETTRIDIVSSDVNFTSAVYDVRRGGMVDITVELAAPTIKEIEIPYQIDGVDAGVFTIAEGDTIGTLPALYEADKATHNRGDLRAITLSAVNTADAIVTLGSLSTADIDVKDERVQFASDKYSVAVNGDVDIDVQLASPAIGLETVLPLSVKINGVETSADETVKFDDNDPAKIVKFDATGQVGGTIVEFSFDELHANWPADMTPFNNTIATITVNDLVVEFNQDAAFDFLSGDTFAIPVTMTGIRANNISIPILAVEKNPGGIVTKPSYVIGSITFPQGSGNSLVGTFTANAAYVAAKDSTVEFSFGTLPNGVTAGTKSDIVATIREIEADFDAANYSVRGGASVNVKVLLSHSVTHSSGSITVPVAGTIYLIDGTTAPFAETVIIANGQSDETLTYPALPIGGVDIDYIDFGFASTGFTAGVSAGSTITTARIDVDDPDINFGSTSYEGRKGSTLSLDIDVTLATAADATLTIPYTIDGVTTDALNNPYQIVFNAGDPVTKTITHTDSSKATFTYAFGTPLPDGVREGKTATFTTVSIIDSSINFGATTYNVREGVTVDIGLILANSIATGITNLPLSVITTPPGGTPSLPVIEDGTISANLRQNAHDYDSTGVAPGTTIAYSFNTASDNETIVLADGTTVVDGITAGTTTPTSTITVTDSAVNFVQPATPYTVRETNTIMVAVELATAPATGETINVPIRYSTDGGVTYTDDIIPITGGVGGSFPYTPITGTAGTVVEFIFDDMSTIDGLKPGTVTNAQVTVKSNSIAFDAKEHHIYPTQTGVVTINIPGGVSGPTSVPYKRTVTLSSSTTTTFLDADFVPGEVSKALPDYIAPANEEGATVFYQFDNTIDFHPNANDNSPWPAGLFDIDATLNNSTITVRDGSVQFEQGNYPARVGDIVTLKVELVAPAIGSGADNDVKIPITEPVGEPAVADVSIADGDSDGTFTYTATANGVFTYTLGTLSGGLKTGTPSSATVTVTSADIDFDVASYNVREGVSVDIDINLPGQAIGETKVPLKVTTTSGGVAGPPTYETAVFANGAIINNTFSYIADASGRGTTVRYEFDVNGDGYAADPVNNVEWPNGITAGTTTPITTITVLDSAIKFSPNTYDARETIPETITIELASPASGTIYIPITVTSANAPAVPDVEILDGTKTGTFTYTAPASSSGTIVTYDFGSALPAGVKLNIDDPLLNTATVNVVDGAINFDAAQLTTVRAGAKVTVNVRLLNPTITALTIPIKLITTPSGSVAQPATYVNVDIPINGSSGSFDYNALLDNKDDTIKFEFDDNSDGNTASALDINTSLAIEPWPVGVNEGSSKPDVTVTVLDPSVDFFEPDDPIAVGATKDIALVMASPAVGETIVPIRYTTDGGATYSYASVTFADGDTISSQPYQFSDATLTGGTIIEFSLDDTDADDATVDWPAAQGVKEGTTQITSTLTVLSDDISFTLSDKTATDAIYRVNHTSDTVDVGVTLSGGTFAGTETIPLKVTKTLCEGTGTPAVSYKDVTVVFTNGVGTFTYDPTTDSDPYNTKLKFEFDVASVGGGATWNQAFGVDSTKDEVTACVTATIGFSADVALERTSETVHTSTVILDATVAEATGLPVTLKTSVDDGVTPVAGADVPVTVLTSATTELVEQGVFATYEAGNTVTYSFDDTQSNWPKWLEIKQDGGADDVLNVELKRIVLDFDAAVATQSIYRDSKATIKVKAPVTWVLPVGAPNRTIALNKTYTMTDGTVGTPTVVTMSLDGTTGEGTLDYDADDATIAEVKYEFLTTDGDWSNDFAAGTTVTEATIEIRDRGISFELPVSGTQTIVGGQTATITVTLDSPAIGAIDVPILITGRENVGTPSVADLPDAFEFLNFLDGEQSKTLSYIGPADGTEVVYDFDTANAANAVLASNPVWPQDTDKDGNAIDKLIPVAPTNSTITVQNPVVEFALALHDIRQGGTLAVDAKLSGNAGVTIKLPIKITNDLNSDTDYVEAEFLIGTDTGPASFTIPITDTVGKVYTYTFDTASEGNAIPPVNPGDPVIVAWPAAISVGATIPTTTATVLDSGLNFNIASVNMRAGATATYKVQLNSNALVDMDIPINTKFTPDASLAVSASDVDGPPVPILATQPESVDIDYTAPVGSALGAVTSTTVIKLLDLLADGVTPNPDWLADTRADTPNEITFTISDPTIQFSALEYDVREGTTATVTINLPGGAINGTGGITQVQVKETIFYTNGNSPLPTDLTIDFNDGDTTKDITKAIPNDGTVDRIEYSFDATRIPNDANFTPTGITDTVVTVLSSVVEFAQANYDLTPTDPPQVIRIELASVADALTTEIPYIITPTYNDGTPSTPIYDKVTVTQGNDFSDDIIFTPAANITSFVYSFDPNEVNNAVTWPSALRLDTNGTNSSTVSVGTNSVNFDSATNPPAQVNDTVTMTVRLQENNSTGSPIVIPLIVTATNNKNIADPPDYSYSVSIADGTDADTVSYTVPADKQGYTINVALDTGSLGNASDATLPVWPAAFQAGTVAPDTEIIVSHGKIAFDRANDNVAPLATKTIRIDFDAIPAATFDIPVKITRVNPTVNGGAPLDTYDKITVTDVTISYFDLDITANSGDTSITYTFDTVNNEHVANGDWPAHYDDDGTPASVTLTVDAAAVNFDVGAFNVREGGTATLQIEIAQAPLANIVIPIKRTVNGGLPDYISATILAGKTDLDLLPLTYIAPASTAGQDVVYEFDTVDSEDNTNGDWPATLNVGTGITISTISIKSGGVTLGTVANNGNIRLGETVNFDVTLDSPALVANYELPYSDDGTTKPLTYPLGGTVIPISHVASSDRNDIGTTYIYELLDGDASWPVDAYVIGAKTVTFTLTDPNIDFDIATQTVADGDVITVKINLPGGAIGATTVPVIQTITRNDGTPDSTTIPVLFADGATEDSTITYTVPTSNDVANDLAGDVVSVSYAFDTANATWPAGLDATAGVGRTVTSTFTVDNDVIEFEKPDDNVAVGATLDITVSTVFDVDGDITIPMKRTEYTGAVAGVITYPTVTISANSKSGTFTYALPTVGVDSVVYELYDTTIAGNLNDGTYPRWPAGFTAGTTKVMTITISDTALNFETTDYYTKAGETINNTDSNQDVRLVLTKALTSAVNVPIAVTEYSGPSDNTGTPLPVITVPVPDSVTEVSLPLYTSAVDSHGKRYEYTLATTTAGWAASGFTVGNAAPVSHLHVKLSSVVFEKPEYDVLAGDDIDVTIKFDRALNDTSIQIPLKLTTTSKGGDVSYDYIIVQPAAASDDFITFTHSPPLGTNGSTVDIDFDTDDRDDNTLDWPEELFYLVTGTQTDTRINVDNKFVNFKLATQNVREGGTAQTVLVLAEPQAIDVDIPITITETGELPRNETVTIIAGNLESDPLEPLLSYTPAAPTGFGAAFSTNAGNTATYDFNDTNGNLPPHDMKVGSVTPESVVTVTDSRVNFELSTGDVREGIKNFDVKLILASPIIAATPGDTTTISASRIFQPHSSDSTNNPGIELANFVFADGGTEATYSFDAVANSKGGTYNFSFSGIVLPADIREGTTSTSTFTIQDADANFIAHVPDVPEVEPNTTRTIVIELESNAIGTLIPNSNPAAYNDVIIPLAITENGILLSTTEPVTIPHGTKTGSFDYSPLPIDAGTVRTYTLDSTTTGWPADSGVTPGDTLTDYTVTVPLGDVSFDDATLDARKGTIPVVNVTLTAAAVVPTEIPITITINGVLSADVTKAEFAVGDTQATVEILLPLNTAIGDTYAYGFGAALPSGVGVDATADNSVVTLKDDAIDFEIATRTVRAGQDTETKIKLIDNAGLDSTGQDNGIAIPIIRTFTPSGAVRGGGSDVVTYDSVTFNEVDNEETLTDITLTTEGGGEVYYEFDTADAGFGLDPNHPQWPAGFTTGTGAGRIPTRTVTVTDSSVKFDTDARDVDYNTDETITVTLATPHVVGEPDIIVPIKWSKIDKDLNPVIVTNPTFNLTFTAGADTQTIIYGDDADEVDVGGTKIKYEFDTTALAWQADVSPSIVATDAIDTTITILETLVDFSTPITYDVRKGDSQTFQIILNKPLTQAGDIYYTIERNNTLENTDKVVFSSADVNVTTIKDVTYDSSADAAHVAGNVITFEFDDTNSFWASGVVVGTNGSITIDIKDSDVYFEASTYDVRRGGSTDMVMKLASPAITALSIPYTMGGTVKQATFASGADSFTIPHASPVTDSISDSVVYAIIDTAANPLPSGVTMKTANDATRPSASTITTISDEIYFDNVTPLTVREGGGISFDVTLAEPSDRDGMIVPISSILAPADGTADVPRTNIDITFDKGVTKKTVIFNDTAGVTEQGVITYGFATGGPADVRSQGFREPTRTVTVTDSRVTFEQADYVIGFGGLQPIKVILASPATEAMTINVQGVVTNLDNSTATINEPLAFAKGDTEKTFNYTTTNYGVGSIAVYNFTNLGTIANAKVGAIPTATVDVERIGVQFAESVYNTPEGQDTVITLKLVSASTSQIDIPIRSGSNTQVVTFPANIATKTATISTSALVGGDVLSYSFGTLPDEVKAEGNLSALINITPTAVEFTTTTSTPGVGDPAEFLISLPAVASAKTEIPLVRTTTHTDSTIRIDELDAVVFEIGEKTKKITDIVPNFSPWLTAKYEFGDLPAGLTEGAKNSHTVTSSEQTVTFGQATYNVVADASISVNIPITLSTAATQAYAVEISLYANIAGGATTTTQTVNFAIGDTTKNITFTGSATNTVNDTYIYSLGTLPAGLAEGAIDSSEITLVSPILVNFEQSITSYTQYNDIATKVILSEPAPAGGVAIKVRATPTTGLGTPPPTNHFAQEVSLSFAEGQTEQSYIYVTNGISNSTFIDNHKNTRIELEVGNSLSALPAGYAAGTTAKHTLSFTASTTNSVRFDKATQTIFQGNNGVVKLLLEDADSANIKRLTLRRTGNFTDNITIDIPAGGTEGLYNLPAIEKSTLGTTSYTVFGVQKCPTATPNTCSSDFDVAFPPLAGHSITVVSNLISFENANIASDTASTAVVKLQIPFSALADYDIPLIREVTLNGNITTDNITVTIPKGSAEKSIVVDGSDYVGNDVDVKYSLPATVPYGLVVDASKNTSEVNIVNTSVGFTKSNYDVFVHNSISQTIFEIQRQSASGVTGSANAVVSINGNPTTAAVTANSSAAFPTIINSYPAGTVLTFTLLPNHANWTVPTSETPGPITTATATVHASASITFDNTDDGYGVAGNNKAISLTRGGNNTLCHHRPCETGY